jgi:hypothetical protein
VQGARVVGLAAAGAGGAVTFGALRFPQAHFAFRQPLLHAAVETAASLIALLASSLVFSRLLRHSHFNALVLASALAEFTLINIFFLATAALAGLASKALMVWTLLAARSIGAVLFAYAAFAPYRRVRRPGLILAVWTAVGSTAVLLTAALANVFAGPLMHTLVASFGPDPQPGRHKS